MTISPDDILTFSKNVGIPLITALAAWNKESIKAKLGFKKETKNIESQTIQNLENIINSLQRNLDIYQEMVEDLSAKFKNEVADLKADLEETRKKLAMYKENCTCKIKQD